MDPERWKRIDSLLRSAQERAPEERDAYLRRECRDDDALVQEVQSLLSSHQKLGDFMESPAVEVAARSLALQPDTQMRDMAEVTRSQSTIDGERFGPYRIVGTLGSAAWARFSARSTHASDVR